MSNRVVQPAAGLFVPSAKASEVGRLDSFELISSEQVAMKSRSRSLGSGLKPASTPGRRARYAGYNYTNPAPSVFSPLAKALLDGFSEGVVVFDPDGRMLYANTPAREALTDMLGPGRMPRA